jgi:hypothetical protein
MTTPRVAVAGLLCAVVLALPLRAESVLGRTDDFTLVDKIHITFALYILIAAISRLSRDTSASASGSSSRGRSTALPSSSPPRSSWPST